MTQVVDLNGNIRSLVGKNVGSKLLRVGKIPAVIYGENGEPNINIELDIKEFEKEYFKGNVELKIFNLNIDGKIYKVVPYLIDIHPVSDRPRHIDFIQVEGKKEIKVLVPLTFKNREKSPGLKKGGYLNIISRKIQLFVDPNNIPSEILIDLEGLHLKSSVKLSQIKLPEGTRSITKKDINLCTIVGRGKSDIGETADAAAPAK
jgi:large subunit ribosomal protein L25